MLIRPALSIAIVAVLLLGACSPATKTETTDAPAGATPVESAPTAATKTTTEPVELPIGVVRTPTGPVSGNRVQPGSGTISKDSAVDVPLTGIPRWIIGGSGPDGVVWVVALDDGRLEAWQLDGGTPIPVALNLDRLPPGSPPVIIATPDGITVVEPPSDASPTSHPLPLRNGGLAYVTSAGLVVVAGPDGLRHEFDVAALPDARITESDDGLIAILTGATTRYAHGVLGDDLEAAKIVILDPTVPGIVGEATIADPAVIEGLAAVWGDVEDDGRQEILVTVSDAEVGARLVIFDRDGATVAEGPPIGRGNRWRNQLGVGPTGPNGETEIVDIRVPHIGGVVEYFRIGGGELVFQTQQRGYTSHVLGSRNLDMALGVDVTGDGLVDVVAPNQGLRVLGILSRTDDGVTVADELPLPDRLTTNVAVGVDGAGSFSLAVGTADGGLRIWPAG